VDIHTAEPLVPEPSLDEVKIAIGKLKSYCLTRWVTASFSNNILHHGVWVYMVLSVCSRSIILQLNEMQKASHKHPYATVTRIV